VKRILYLSVVVGLGEEMTVLREVMSTKVKVCVVERIELLPSLSPEVEQSENRSPLSYDRTAKIDHPLFPTSDREKSE
jgi:hypothetical protein